MDQIYMSKFKEFERKNYNEYIIDLTEYLNLYINEGKETIANNKFNISAEDKFNLEALITNKLDVGTLDMNKFIYSLDISTTNKTKVYFVFKEKGFAYLKDDFIICEEIDIVGFETIDKES